MASASETVRIIRVFVSSPGDVQEERAVLDEIVGSINRTDGSASGFRLELFRWEENVTPQIGPKPQRVVDDQTPQYDIYLGIMSTRFGTRTGRHGSGTEKEFRDALKKWKDAKTPWITFYFNDAPKLSRKPDDVQQYLKVCQFREELEKKGIVCGYSGVRGSAEGFYEKVSEHLRTIVRQLTSVDQGEERGTRRNDPVAAKPVVPREYTDWLLRRCGEVELLGLERKQSTGVRLNHVYTPLTTSTRLDHQHPLGRKKGRNKPDMEQPEQPERAQLLLDLLNQRSLYVSGDPGSGKSTFCRWVTWLTSNGVMPAADVPTPDEFQEPFPNQLRQRLPVLMRLRDFWPYLPTAAGRTIGHAGLEDTVRKWLAEQNAPGVDWSCLKGHLEIGSALMILDGVDEVPPVRKGDAGEEWYPREMLLEGLAEAAQRWTAAYQQLDGSTDKGLGDTVHAREDLLSQSGLLVSRGDDRASFYHLSLQEFLAAERLFVLRARQPQGFRDLLLERGPSAAWRNTLSFVFGSVVTKFNAHVGVELLQGVVERTELPAVDPARRGQGAGVWNLAIVLGDCLEILLGREANVPAELRNFFERAVKLAIEQEISIKERHTLAVALGRLGDPRIVTDLRDPAAYVEIRPGTYRIGDNQLRKEWSWVLEEASFDVEAPFRLSRFPVTNSQFALFLREGGYREQKWWSEAGWQWLQQERVTEPLYWRNPKFSEPNQPVVDVSFWEAEAFARWADGRLPTEREWEAAARGLAGFVYPFGDDWEDGICNSHEAGLGPTSVVGIFPRSRSAAFELEDMAGNVWEWCADEDAAFRVVRGGSWASAARGCRSADRGKVRAGEPRLQPGLSRGPSSVRQASRVRRTKQAEPGA